MFVIRRLFVLLIILFTFYLGLEYAFKILGPGHNIVYEISDSNNVYLVKESYTARQKDEVDNYYFDISVNGKSFYYQTFMNFRNDDRVIENIYYFENDQYACLLPVYKNGQILSDFKCYDDNDYYYYNLISGLNSELDNYINNLDLSNYSYETYLPRKSNPIVQSHLEIYPDNLVENHYLGLTTYKGIYNINKHLSDNISLVSIFNKDIYEQNISAYVDKYYVVADYNSDYSFTNFTVVDLTNNRTRNLISRHQISFDSYFQGSVDDRLYLVDRRNSRQFELDLRSFTILEYGNANTGVRIYRNGDWKVEPMSRAITSDLLFADDYNIEAEAPYYRIDKVGGELSGYYYYYERKSNQHYVYRSEIQNPEAKTLLFVLDDISEITYHLDSIYFYSGNDIIHYQDSIGLSPIVNNSEYEFNKSLRYSLYIK